MPEWITDLSWEVWALILMGMFLIIFGRLAWEYYKQIFRGIE